MNEVKNKDTLKQKYSKFAILLFILGLSSLYILFMREPLHISRKYEERLILLLLIALITFISGMLLVAIKRNIQGRGFALVGAAASALSLILWISGLFPLHEPPLPGMICTTNLSWIGKAMLIYLNDNNEIFPEADKWCDSLIIYDDLNPSIFVCKGSDAKLNESSYAININLAGKNYADFSKDMVLLFETNFGKNSTGRDYLSSNRNWYQVLNQSSDKMDKRRLKDIKEKDKIYKDRRNQAGGPELLTTENHEGEGCFILFSDGHVEFIEKESIEDLKWNIE